MYPAMRVTRITVTDPTDQCMPIRDVIDMADHSEAVRLLADPFYAERFQREGWRVSLNFVDVDWRIDLRDADAEVHGGRGW